MKEKCEKCKRKIDGSAVARESFGGLLYYHEECFKGKVPSSFVFMREVKGAVGI